MSRPEKIAPPEVFYNDEEAKKYAYGSRYAKIQAEMTQRALELLNVPPGQHILDIGAGSGLSGEILTEEGHIWVGMDISPSMIANAIDREIEGDMFLADMGNGIPFRAGSFDAAISISAIQWLCNADRADVDPKRRLLAFFRTLYASLKRGGKVVCQFYPMDDKQTEAITSAAKATGFAGGVVIDGEGTKSVKFYLVLSAGIAEQEINLAGVSVDDAGTLARNKPRLSKRSRDEESKRDYIQRKKELMKKRGKKVAKDSKFTGRQRRPRF